MKKFSVILVIFVVQLVNGVPVPSYTDVSSDSDSFVPDEKIIDINNPDQNDMEKFHEMNIDLTALREQQQELKSRMRMQNGGGGDSDGGNVGPSTSDIASDEGVRGGGMSNTLMDRPSPMLQNDQNLSMRQQYEHMALEAYRQMIESSILRNNSSENPPQLSSGDVNHYTAAHPQCTPPKNINTTSFFNSGNTWNLYFSPPASENPQNAILRLYKLPDEIQRLHNGSDCSQPEELIRITVSYYVKRRDKRKRLCSSIMVSKYFTGWIELDVKPAVKYWNRVTNPNTRKNYGMAIDVQDQDEMPLRASGLFHNYNCEAYIAIPWNFYKEQSPRSLDTTVPRIPRIDIQQRTFLPPMPIYRHTMFSARQNFGYQLDQSSSSSEQSFSTELEQKSARNHHLHHHSHRHHHLNGGGQRNHRSIPNRHHSSGESDKLEELSS